ncbi:SCO6880 family protein [Pseudonocardia xishanensis]|uniref:Type VII ESX secretion system EccE translocon n=1 Tax=Pseudonocardia xishanensis TaxID=630995 RepID=A0ABP8S2J0_9PSEU
MTEKTPRLYGNWRAERGWGIGNLSTTTTVVLFLAILGPLLAFSTVPRAALPMAGISVLLIGALVIRVNGVTLAEFFARVGRFRRARAAGWTEWTGGILTAHPRGADLPGILGPTVPVDADDGRGGRHCWLWDRRSGRLSAVLRISPVGLDLADDEQTDRWVAGWAALLADLGYQRLVVHLAVTVDTAPTGGTTTRDHVASSLDPHAPALARRVLDELVAAHPESTADIDARVTVTMDPQRASPKPADLVEATIDAGRGLPAIEQGLAGAGVAVLGRAGTAWLTNRIRAAFDPAARRDLSTDRSLVDNWSAAGPIAASETWDDYRHDSGLSVTWGMREAPRQAVSAHVLTPLLAPGPYPRRVTVLYEPYDAQDAAAKVEAEITSGQVRRAWAERTRRDETQRDRDDRDRALQSAREEAEGAGLGRFSVYVTTTVVDPDDLAAAVSDVETRAGQAKIRLRRLRGSQAAAFAVALGVGLEPVHLARRGHR